MSWRDKQAPKINKVGRPPIDNPREQIRPTVSQESKLWLESQGVPIGRTIDKLIAIYQMQVNCKKEALK